MFGLTISTVLSHSLSSDGSGSGSSESSDISDSSGGTDISLGSSTCGGGV